MIATGLLILSYFLTYIIKRVAVKHSLLDIPNERSSHEIPTPRGGGLAIVVSWFTGITILFFTGNIESSLYFALISGVFLAIISLIDDIIDLSPFVRLLIQTITALVALYFLDGFASVNLSGLKISAPALLYPFALIGIVWFINLFNFLDGIDGYASLEAIVIAALMLIFSSDMINVILIACIAGFLFWNWPRAKIFMGDIGSTQLGFILVILGIYYHNTAQFSIIHWLMISSLFWFDATLTLFRRWKNKEKLSVAHRKHAYQRAVQSGLSHKNTILISLFVNIVIAGFIFISAKIDFLMLPLFIINLLILYMITRIIDSRVPFN